MGAIWTVLPSSHYVLLATLFFIGLELMFALQRWVWPVLAILFVVIASGVVLIKIEEHTRFHPTQAILPLLAAAGMTAFALFLPGTALIHLYLAVASVVFYILLKFAARTAYPTWNWVVSLLVLFLNLSVVLGWHFHLFITLVFSLALAWAATFLISWQALRRVRSGRGVVALMALVLSFVLTQILWVLQFTPLHFLIQASFTAVLYYVSFHLLSISFERSLTRRDVWEFLGVGAAALVVLLGTAQWV